MPIHVKQAGSWKIVKDVWQKQAGVWSLVEIVRCKVTGNWTVVHAAEIVVIVAANQNNIIIKDLFTAEDWASTTRKKKVVLNSGIVAGDEGRANWAVRTGTGRGSVLTINNKGEIQGFGGLANSGDGGVALLIDQEGVTVVNDGAIRGGGGGGGRGGVGGVGGAGVYYALGPSQGNQYNETTHNWRVNTANTIIQLYYGGLIYEGSGNDSITSIDQGSYRYNRGAYVGQISTWSYLVIWRQIISYPYNTSGGAGGAGGAGGRGIGYNQTNQAGAGGALGALGGTNAGRGGTGGTGGAGAGWGQVGNTGNTGGTGANGNNGAGGVGVPGTEGGDGGAAIAGVARTVINNGTINGAQV